MSSFFFPLPHPFPPFLAPPSIVCFASRPSYACNRALTGNLFGRCAFPLQTFVSHARAYAFVRGGVFACARPCGAQGYVIGSCIQHIPIAGRDITNFIQLLMRERESSIPPDDAMDVRALAAVPESRSRLIASPSQDPA
eukprot:6209148-Pleurochrysis_carterae.AAC.1